MQTNNATTQQTMTEAAGMCPNCTN